MTRKRTIRPVLLVLALTACAAAQTADQKPAPTTTDQSQTAPPTPAPAFGQSAPVLNPDNPPVSGLDEPSLELRTATRSFIAPAFQVSESADTNGANQINGSNLESVTRVLGAVDLQQFWPKSDLLLEYLGGGAFYSSPYAAKQLQAVGLEAVTRWRTGQVTLRDSFNYLPDGSFFIGTYGGAPGLGLASGSMGIGIQGGSLPGLVSNSQYGSVGNIPRLANSAILDVVEALGPRSAITVAGGFSNAHFYDDTPPPDTLVNSDQITFEGGYSHLISRHDQFGVVYGFQLFQFPQVSGGEIYNHILNLRWSHMISGRMSLIIGAGPQYTDLELGGSSTHLSVSARAQLHYKLGRSSLILGYEKFTSSGSGFFAGADTQVARFGYRRPLGRTWELYSDIGYSHNKKLQNANLGVTGASSNDDGSAGALFRKHLGRSYDFFASYRFSYLEFNASDSSLDCLAGLPTCGRISHRHAGMVGVEWHPKPTRIE